jgi:hypothetical protein
MKDSERKAWTEFVRQREQASKGKKRERRSEETAEPATEDALDDLLREATTKRGAPRFCTSIRRTDDEPASSTAPSPGDQRVFSELLVLGGS